MRTARVFYLLLSVLQFIFFLKLVEYVRGEEIQSTNNTKASAIFSKPVSSEDEKSRGLFIAPKMEQMKRKKFRNWNNTANAANKDGTESGAVPIVNGNPTTVSPQQKREQFEQEVARMCPACESNDCASVNPISAGFPIVPVIIAVAVGIAWFILFLIFWIFWIRPDTKGDQSGGYGGGYGYGSPENGYGDDSEEKPSIFDHFLKPKDRSFSPSYTQLLHNVLDSIGKLSDLYNSY